MGRGEKTERIISALTSLHDGIRRNRGLEDIAGLIAKNLFETIACRRSIVFLVREDANIMAGMGLSDWNDEGSFRPEALLGHFSNDRVGILAGTCSQIPRIAFFPDTDETVSLLCAPVIEEDIVSGFILAVSPQTEAFDREDLRFAELMASALSTAVGISGLRAEVLSLTMTDDLTGCLNRQKFDDDMEIDLPCAERYGKPLSVLLIAVDHFAGYKASDPSCADGVLRQVGKVLSYSIRMCDKLYYYGDDKFAIVLPGIDKERSVFAAQRILKVIECYDFGEETAIAPEAGITVSIGLASFPADSVYRTGLMKHLDSALLSARRAGGNSIA